MNENFKYAAAGVAVVGLTIGGILYFSQSRKPAPSADPVVAVPPQPVTPAEPAIKHPVPASDGNDALPALDDSSVPMQNALADLFGVESVERFIVTDELIRHIVVSVDNLSEEKVAERLRPIKSPPGGFMVSGAEDALVLDPANYERYRPMVQLLRSTDTQRLVATYVRYYPLFQESYENLGHPPQYFNDRVIEVIDLLLATPDVPGPIALAQPNVQYEFADPKLESLSAGQKALIRMGSENAAAVKQKLREVRGALSSRKPAG
ncbi:MAG: DUF3014 domain-containing protein [Pseudomonadota bacterium]